MKKIRKEKGITLIALIITIVVLLILAIVSIGAVQDSNIVGYAQNAAGGYDKAKGDENNAISDMESLLEKYANGGNSIGNTSGGSNTPVSNLGKYVRYDVDGDGVIETDNEYEAILWRVLRDDDNKVELITADALGTVDLRATSFNDARIKYNGAVELMVDECERLTGIDGVRNVGGPAVDTIDTVVFGNLTTFKPNDGVSFAAYEGDNGFKVADNNYEEDYNQMIRAGVANADNSQEYWLASRIAYEQYNAVCFRVRTYDGTSGFRYFCDVLNDGSNILNTPVSLPVRPVLTLECGILEGKTGAGTSTQPIEIY